MNYHYITPSQLKLLVESAYNLPPQKRSFCHLIAETGCRLGEAAALKGSDVDIGGGCIYLGGDHSKSLKRGVPVSDSFLSDLSSIHGLRMDSQKSNNLWDADRSTYWRWIGEAMALADIAGKEACCVGIRYGRILTWLDQGIEVPTIQQWLGLRSPKTIHNFLQFANCK